MDFRRGKVCDRNNSSPTSPMCAISRPASTKMDTVSILKQNSLRIHDWQNKGYYVALILAGNRLPLRSRRPIISQPVSPLVLDDCAAAWSPSIAGPCCCAMWLGHFFLSKFQQIKSIALIFISRNFPSLAQALWIPHQRMLYLCDHILMLLGLRFSERPD